MSMSAVNIIRIVALVLAVVGAFVTIPYAAAALVILGLVAGFMGVDEDGRGVGSGGRRFGANSGCR